MNHRLDSTLQPLGEIGAADIVVAGGGIAGVTAAGELSAHGKNVLLLEPRFSLMHEIVRARLPADALFSKAGESLFLQKLSAELKRLSPRRQNPALPFSLEIASEKLLAGQGVRLLYLAFAAGWQVPPEGVPLRVAVNTRTGGGVISARQAVLDCTDGAVLLRASGCPGEARAAHKARQVVWLINVDPAPPCELTVKGKRGACRIEIPVADARRRVLAPVYFDMQAPTVENVEFEMAGVVCELLEAVRAHAPAFRNAALAYIGDEPMMEPRFRLAREAASAEGVAALAGAPVFGGGLWSLPDGEPGAAPEVEKLVWVGLALARHILALDAR